MRFLTIIAAYSKTPSIKKSLSNLTVISSSLCVKTLSRAVVNTVSAENFSFFISVVFFSL